MDIRDIKKANISSVLYRDIFSRREYSIMIEHEQNGRKIKELADMYHISSNGMTQIYNRIKRKQVLYYLKAIKNAGITSNGNVLSEFGLYCNYGNYKYAAAFLEQKYYDILSAYRKDEPKNPIAVSEINPEYKPAMPVIKVWKSEDLSEVDCEGYIVETYDSLINIHYRIFLSDSEALIIKLKDEEKRTCKEIARQLKITDATAKRIYSIAKLVQLQIRLSLIKGATGKSISELLDEKNKFLEKYWGKLRPHCWKITENYFKEAYKEIQVM